MVNFSALPPAALVRALVALFLLALRFPAAGQAPGWQSARAVAVATSRAANNFSQVKATAVDAAGNVYLAGNFMNTVVLGGTTLTSLGSFDLFVAKFSPTSNQFVWAQRAGGAGVDYVSALAISGSNVYVSGYFNSTAGFGATVLTNASAGDSDVFVAKLADTGSTGSFVWAQRAGSTGNDDAYALAASGPDVYVAGYFSGSSAVFGSATLMNASAGTSDAFVAKLTDMGSTSSFMWAQRAGGTGNDNINALAISGANMYVAGYFDGSTAAFGASVLANADPNMGSRDIFVAKLPNVGSSGNFVWAQRAGGTGEDGVSALAVSGANVYVAGSFASSTASFGPITLTNVGASDVFVAKLTDAGSTGGFVWAQRAGGTANDNANALVVTGTGLYMAGYFNSPTAVFGTTTLTGTGSFDAYVTKIADAGSTGNFAWVQQGGDAAFALALSGTSIYVAGAFLRATTSFGAISINNPDPFSNLGFLATLTDPTLTATTAALPREPASLFPNPARHAATLRLPAGTAPAPLTLTDALGRPVRRYPAPAAPDAALDLRGLPAGLYLLRGAGPARRLAVE